MADNNQFVQLQTLYLKGSGTSSSATSIDLQSMKFQVSADNVAMADFGAIGYATLEPGTAREENVSFTGITQNGDGSATLTGVTRGLDFAAPYTNVAALQKAHAGGTACVVSNSASFYNELTAKDNDETITGTWTFPNGTPPRIDAYAAPVDDEELAAKKYVDDIAAGGTASINRIVVGATAGETVAAGNAVYFDETDNEWKLANAGAAATSEGVTLGVAQGAGVNGGAISGGVLLMGRESNQSGLTAGDRLYLTDVNGVIGAAAGTKEVEIGHAISATVIDFTPRYDKSLTEDEQDALAGTSGTPSSSNKFVTADDVTEAKTASKIARRDSNGDILVTTTPTASDAAVSLSHFNDNSGEKIAIDLSDVTHTNSLTETDLMSITVAANELGTADGIKFEIPITDLDMVNDEVLTLKLKYGATTVATASIANSDGTSASVAFTNFSGKIEGFLFANASTAVQEGSLSIRANPAGVSKGNELSSIGDVAVGTGAEDSTGALTLAVTADWASASAGNSITIPHIIVTKIH